MPWQGDEHADQVAKEQYAQYEALTRRIAALDSDINRELDLERKETLRERRNEAATERSAVAQLLGSSTMQDLSVSNRHYDDAMDARLSNSEATLRAMTDKIDRLSEAFHQLDIQQKLVEERVRQLTGEIHNLRMEIGAMKGGTATLSRPYLIMAAMLLVIMLVMMIVLTWRVV